MLVSAGKPSHPLDVIMSVYNDRVFLPLAVQSVLAQTWKDFRLLIADDGSTDGTGEILDAIAQQDARVFVLHQENMGLTKTLNKLIRLSTARYIARQDSDDLSHPERFARQIAYLEKHRDVMLLGTSAHIIDTDGEVLKTEYQMTGSRRLARALRSRNRFIHGSVMFRRQCLEKVGLYEEHVVTAEDYDLFLRISEHFKVDNLYEPLYLYRIHPHSISVKKCAMQQRMVAVIREAARLRRKGKINSWSGDVYEMLNRRVSTPFRKRLERSNVHLELGRTHRLNGRIADARKDFLAAVLLIPSPRRLYHLLRLLVLHR